MIYDIFSAGYPFIFQAPALYFANPLENGPPLCMCSVQKRANVVLRIPLFKR